MGLAIVLIAGVLALYLYPTERVTTNLAVRAQEYCGMENVAAVEVARREGYIKVTSALLGGGATYNPEDGGQPLECPVVGPDAMSDACRDILQIDTWEPVCAAEELPSDEDAERLAFTFMQDVVKIAPPESDAQAANRVMEVLSTRAKDEVTRQTIATDIAQFVGVQDVPDRGISVEDLQKVSDIEAYVVVGLNYSGSGRVLRSIHLVVEDGAWKVDRVSAPEQAEAEPFEAEGNLVRNNPGMEPDIWYLVYESPGAPGLSKALQFESTSVCAQGVENNTCDLDAFEPGQRVFVLGDVNEDDSVRVIRLEER